MQDKRGITESRSLRPRWRQLSIGVIAASAVIALAIAGCGSSSKTSSTSSAAGSSTGSSSSSAATGGGSSSVSAALAKFEALPTYSLPKASLKSASKLRGKLIYYIPVASVVPEFAITAASLRQAAAAVGAKLQVCSDPQGTPSEWNSCVGQGIAAKAAAIVLDAAPWQVVANLLGKAQGMGIKVVLADQQPSTTFSAPGKNAFMLGVSGTMQTAAADWIISDSGGSGDAIVVQNTDGPSPPWYISNFMLPEFKKYAPNLKYTIQPISTANQQQLSSDISSALLKNPDAKYIHTEFDQFTQDAQQGVQSANDINKVKGVSAAALLSGLQALKAQHYLYADAGQDYPYTGWAIADLAYRLMLGQPAVTENIPMRLFTRQNVSSVSLTNAAQSDGSWYGPTNFPTLFKKLWGVS